MRLAKHQIKKFLPLLLLVPLMYGGCCSTMESNPERPSQVRGWNRVEQRGVRSLGEFLLTKTTPVEEQTYGIELKDVIRGRNCQGTESVGPKALVRLYRLPDKETLMELELTEGNTRIITFNRSVAETYNLDTIAVRAINTKDAWVWFEIYE